jgi:hypothetical protein
MEAAALFAIAGIGYVITRLTGRDGDYDGPEGFQAAQTLVAQNGAKQELDLRYSGIPSEPNPGVQGTLLNYVAPKPQYADMNPASRATPQPTNRSAIMSATSDAADLALQDIIEAATPDVAMNPAGIEAQPNYLDGDFVVSQLTGERMKTGEFVHNNMTPFFGGRVRQNVAPQSNSGILDSFTGSGVTQIAKKETESMFNTQTPFGNPFGLESATDFVQSRMNESRSRAGERPFEPVRVAPGVNEGFAATGKGGFQQLEVNQYMIDNIRRTDDLRTADDPKLTYKQPVVPGQHFVGSASDAPGEVRKYRPDTFFIDETGERLFVTTGDQVKGATRPIQVMKHQTRPETSAEMIGPAGSQDFGESYVVGSFRTPMAQQYGGSGYRNADMSSYTSKDTDAAANDYGRSGYEVRPNERMATSERVMGLNLTPAEAGGVTAHYTDENRPTRRQEIVGNIRQTGTAVGYASGAPAVTVWDPNDIARTTVKEGTVNFNWFGQAGPADGPTRLKTYDPDDIARPTQKSQLSAKSEHYGPSYATNKDFTSHDAAFNMRSNPNKERIAVGRSPLQGNGGALAVFDGNLHQTSKKLGVDSVNDRANTVTRVEGIPTGVGDIGTVRYRAPLKMDVSRVRNGPEVVSAVNANPLMAAQNLRMNAGRDEQVLSELLAAM